jgi:hypothetical protein
LQCADEKEVNEALTRHADKLYEGVEKVDRSGLDVDVSQIAYLIGSQNFFNQDGFRYKGVFVMDREGRWAVPVPSIKKMTIEDIEKELGYKFELVKVG